MMSDEIPSWLKPLTASSETERIANGIEAFGKAFVPILNGVLAVRTALARAVQQVLERPDVRAGIADAAGTLKVVHDGIAAVGAPGYAPYFERLGHSGLAARLHVLMIRSCAERYFRENQDRRVALSALHDLAGRPRWHPALARQVALLQDNRWEADFLDEACSGAGCPALKGELLSLLGRTRGGDHSGGARLIEIAARIAPYAPSPRGRPVEFDTVLHQTFLRWSAGFGGRQAYTFGLPRDDRDAPIEDFIDEATAATRIELKRPSFNPVSARRAERRRIARERVDETVNEVT